MIDTKTKILLISAFFAFTLATASAALPYMKDFAASTGRTLKYSQIAAVGAPEPETTTLLNAMTVKPSAARIALYDNLITSLKNAGVWQKLDVLYIFAAHDSQAALINIKNPGTYNATPVGTTTFEVDRGFSTNALTSYLNTNYRFVSSNFTQNSAHIGIWSNTDVAGPYIDGGDGGTVMMLLRDASNALAYRLNYGGNGTGYPTVTNSMGHFLINRNSAATVDAYKNSVKIGTVNMSASPVQTTSNLYLLRRNSSTGAFSPRQQSAAHVGAGLSLSEEEALYAALATYMQTVGLSTQPPPAPTVTFSADPSLVQMGGNSTLIWSSTSATSCTASKDWSGVKTRAGSEVIANISAAKSFTIVCSGAGGSATANASIGFAASAVAPPASPEPPKGSDGVYFSDLTPSKYLWVRAGASAPGNGSSASPFPTIMQAVGVATPGTAIMVGAGTYNEAVDLAYKKGTPTQPIWLVSADGLRKARIMPPSGARAGIVGGGIKNWVIEGFEIGNAQAGVFLALNGDTSKNYKQFEDINRWTENVVLRGMYVHDIVRDDGFKNTQVNNIQLLDNTIDNAAQECIDFLAVTNALAARNECSRPHEAAGIFAKAGSLGVKIYDNYVHDSSVHSVAGISVGGQGTADYYYPGRMFEASNVEVRGNKVERVTGGYPINVYGGVNSLITENYMDTTGTTAYYAMAIEQGHAFTGKQAAGFNTNPHDITISNNIILGPRTSVGNGRPAEIDFVRDRIIVSGNSTVGTLSHPVGPQPFALITPPALPTDTTAPTVSMTAPAGSVSGTSVAVSANASDNIGVVGVQFKLDGAALGAEDTTAPYAITWNSASTTNGSHSLVAVARDAAGNRATSTASVVTAANTIALPSTRQMTAVTTFNSISLYWKAETGASTRAALVRYRPQGSSMWKEASPMWFDARTHTSVPARSQEYRGSIVLLDQNTTYEVQASVEGTGEFTSVNAKTMSENFPIAKTVVLPATSNQPLNISESGTPTGYILYTALPSGSVIDTAGAAGTNNVNIGGSYVILRGMTLKNAAVHGVAISSGAHDVVIENNDISGWGRIMSDGWGMDLDSGIARGAESTGSRIIIQNNRIHNPRSNANDWNTPRPAYANNPHPAGPQAITLFNTSGGNVIRYNEIYSDATHYFNDCIGGASNFSYKGAPGPDSDIYGNSISNCWDDAIESEGGNQNIRIWGNYIDKTYQSLAFSATSLGPLYVFRNVTYRTNRAPDRSMSSGSFIKAQERTEGSIHYGDGRVYVFNNTLYRTSYNDGNRDGIQPSGSRLMNYFTRNNILNTVSPSIEDPTKELDNNFDYDLYSVAFLTGTTTHELHGIRQTPVYDPGNASGIYTLQAGSPGQDACVRIPNFTDGFLGAAPDCGAQERGAPALRFGLRSTTVVPPPATTTSDTTAPTVSLTAPTGTVSGTSVTVSANTSDNVGVVGVQFKIDGAILGAEDTSAQYATAWNTTIFSNGAHTLIAVARDAAGNYATSSSVSVLVTNSTPDITPPTVSLTAPGASVSGAGVAVSASASDNTAVVGVQFKLDNNALGAEDTSAPYSIVWNSTQATNGSHTLVAVARDAAGNRATSTSRAVSVSNTIPLPFCNLTASPRSKTIGQSANLAWRTTNSTSISINQNIGVVTPVASGSRVVAPTTTTIYIATSTGAGGSTTCSETIIVSATSSPIIEIPRGNGGTSNSGGSGGGGGGGSRRTSSRSTSSVAASTSETPSNSSGAGSVTTSPSSNTADASASASSGSSGGSGRVTLTRRLALNSQGEDVRALQQFLIRKSYLKVPAPTSFYGTLTAGAVGKYQCDKKIVCDGTETTTGFGAVGPQTIAIINAEEGGSTASQATVGSTGTRTLAPSGLTSAQAGAIINLLQSFGADADVVANVREVLEGGTLPASANPSAASPAPSVNSSAATLTRDLYFGMSGTDVATLQQLLKNKGFFTTEITGYFGVTTKEAVMKFQTANGIEPLGGVGTITRGKILQQF